MRTIVCLAIMLVSLPVLWADEYRPLGGSIGVIKKDAKGKEKSEGIVITSTVTKKGDKYLYKYVIENTSTTQVHFVSWEVTNRVAFGSGMMWSFKPGQKREITLEHKKPPVPFSGMLTVWVSTAKDKAEDWKESLEPFGIRFDDYNDFWHARRCSMSGYLPKSLTKKD